jgi:hypothetical protein
MQADASHWYDASHGGVQAQPDFASPAGVTNYTSYAGGGSPAVASVQIDGTANAPTFIKINGDFTVPGGKSFTITTSGSSDKYATIWVTGKFTTSGSGLVTQTSKAHVTWIVDSDITASGDSYQNQSGLAGNVAFIGVGIAHKLTVSGGASFIGTVNAPGFDATISGTGSFIGGIIANTLTISGGAGLHYDEALNAGAGGSTANYAYASWFEDNSDPARGITY